MTMVDLEEGLEYANFKAWVPERRLRVGKRKSESWKLYDWGRKDSTDPLLCVHDVLGAGDIFFQQMLYLVPRGYRVLSVCVPTAERVMEVVEGLERLLKVLRVKRVHLYGTGMGAFLCFMFATTFPEKVCSIALTHAALSLDEYRKRVTVPRWLFKLTPSPVFEGVLLDMAPTGAQSISDALGIEFAIARGMEGKRPAWISKLLLCTTPEKLTVRLRVPDEYITIIDGTDLASSLVEANKRQIRRRFQGARYADVKVGGEYPYLSSPDDVSIHLLLHLRRHAKAPLEPVRLPPASKATNPDPWESRAKKEAERQAKKQHVEQNRGGIKSTAGMPADGHGLVVKYQKQISQLQRTLPNAPPAQLALALDAANGDVDAVIAQMEVPTGKDQEGSFAGEGQMIETEVNPEGVTAAGDGEHTPFAEGDANKDTPDTVAEETPVTLAEGTLDATTVETVVEGFEGPSDEVPGSGPGGNAATGEEAEVSTPAELSTKNMAAEESSRARSVAPTGGATEEDDMDAEAMRRLLERFAERGKRLERQHSSRGAPEQRRSEVPASSDPQGAQVQRPRPASLTAVQRNPQPVRFSSATFSAAPTAPNQGGASDSSEQVAVRSEQAEPKATPHRSSSGAQSAAKVTVEPATDATQGATRTAGRDGLGSTERPKPAPEGTGRLTAPGEVADELVSGEDRARPVSESFRDNWKSADVSPVTSVEEPMKESFARIVSSESNVRESFARIVSSEKHVNRSMARIGSIVSSDGDLAADAADAEYAAPQQYERGADGVRGAGHQVEAGPEGLMRSGSKANPDGTEATDSSPVVAADAVPGGGNTLLENRAQAGDPGEAGATANQLSQRIPTASAEVVANAGGNDSATTLSTFPAAQDEARRSGPPDVTSGATGDVDEHDAPQDQAGSGKVEGGGAVEPAESAAKGELPDNFVSGPSTTASAQENDDNSTTVGAQTRSENSVQSTNQSVEGNASESLAAAASTEEEERAAPIEFEMADLGRNETEGPNDEEEGAFEETHRHDGGDMRIAKGDSHRNGEKISEADDPECSAATAEAADANGRADVDAVDAAVDEAADGAGSVVTVGAAEADAATGAHAVPALRAVTDAEVADADAVAEASNAEAPLATVVAADVDAPADAELADVGATSAGGSVVDVAAADADAPAKADATIDVDLAEAAAVPESADAGGSVAPVVTVTAGTPAAAVAAANVEVAADSLAAAAPTDASPGPNAEVAARVAVDVAADDARNSTADLAADVAARATPTDVSDAATVEVAADISAITAPTDTSAAVNAEVAAEAAADVAAGATPTDASDAANVEVDADVSAVTAPTDASAAVNAEVAAEVAADVFAGATPTDVSDAANVEVDADVSAVTAPADASAAVNAEVAADAAADAAAGATATDVSDAANVEVDADVSAVSAPADASAAVNVEVAAEAASDVAAGATPADVSDAANVEVDADVSAATAPTDTSAAVNAEVAAEAAADFAAGATPTDVSDAANVEVDADVSAVSAPTDASAAVNAEVAAEAAADVAAGAKPTDVSDAANAQVAADVSAVTGPTDASAAVNAEVTSEVAADVAAGATPTEVSDNANEGGVVDAANAANFGTGVDAVDAPAESAADAVTTAAPAIAAAAADSGAVPLAADAANDVDAASTAESFTTAAVSGAAAGAIVSDSDTTATDGLRSPPKVVHWASDAISAPGGSDAANGGNPADAVDAAYDADAAVAAAADAVDVGEADVAAAVAAADAADAAEAAEAANRVAAIAAVNAAQVAGISDAGSAVAALAASDAAAAAGNVAAVAAAMAADAADAAAAADAVAAVAAANASGTDDGAPAADGGDAAGAVKAFDAGGAVDAAGAADSPDDAGAADVAGAADAADAVDAGGAVDAAHAAGAADAAEAAETTDDAGIADAFTTAGAVGSAGAAGAAGTADAVGAAGAAGAAGVADTAEAAKPAGSADDAGAACAANTADATDTAHAADAADTADAADVANASGATDVTGAASTADAAGAAGDAEPANAANAASAAEAVKNSEEAARKDEKNESRGLADVLLRSVFFATYNTLLPFGNDKNRKERDDQTREKGDDPVSADAIQADEKVEPQDVTQRKEHDDQTREKGEDPVSADAIQADEKVEPQDAVQRKEYDEQTREKGEDDPVSANAIQADEKVEPQDAVERNEYDEQTREKGEDDPVSADAIQADGKVEPQDAVHDVAAADSETKGTEVGGDVAEDGDLAASSTAKPIEQSTTVEDDAVVARTPPEPLLSWRVQAILPASPPTTAGESRRPDVQLTKGLRQDFPPEDSVVDGSNDRYTLSMQLRGRRGWTKGARG